MRRLLAALGVAGVIAVGLAAAPVACAQGALNPPSALPAALPAQYKSQLASQRATVQSKFDALVSELNAHNARCTSVSEKDTATLAACDVSSAKFEMDFSAYGQLLQAYEDAVKAVRAQLDADRILTVDGRTYERSGNGLVGGMTWVNGYFVKPGAPSKIADEAIANLKRQARIAGADYDKSIDPGIYNFAIALADQHSVWGDKYRVFMDELSNGRYTTEIDQNAYNSLKGRHFDELGCHSNGAMICLAALEKKDVHASRVVLYGPQITVESLKKWNQLVLDGKVESVQVMINQNDIVPPIALLTSLLAQPPATALDSLIQSPTLLRRDNMKAAIEDLAPNLGVQTFGCSASLMPGTKCHEMKVYRENRPCTSPPSSGAPVPGTKLPGGRALSEPPPPC